MKNLFTRLLALVVVLSVVLLPASALAAERNAFSLTVSNLEMVIDGEAVTIPVGIQIGGGADLSDPNVRGYGIVNVLSGEESALSLMASVEDGEVRAYLSGMEYGVSVSLSELVMALAPVLQQLEGEVTTIMSSVSPELQAAVIRTVEAYVALIEESLADPTKAYLGQMDNLGITLTEGTEKQNVFLFDVEVEALPTTVKMEEKTVAEIFDAQMNSTEASAEFYAAYFELLSEIAAMSGVEIDVKAAMGEVEGSISMNGAVYTAENGILAELVMSVTIEEETVEFPITLTGLTDENGTYFDLLMEVAENGEQIYFEFYVDDFTDEEGSFGNFIMGIGIGEEEAEAYDTEMSVALFKAERADNVQYGLEMNVMDAYDSMAASLGYYGVPGVHTDEADVYDGFVYLTYADDYESMEFYLDTNLTLTSVPEGELLVLSNSVNPLTGGEDVLEKLAQDAMNAVMQGASKLLQNPEIAALLGN